MTHNLLRAAGTPTSPCAPWPCHPASAHHRRVNGPGPAIRDSPRRTARSRVPGHREVSGHHMCLFVLVLGLLGPRVAFGATWLFTNRVTLAFQGGWIWPLLGMLFLPWTALCYVLVGAPASGVSLGGWIILTLAFLADMGTYMSRSMQRGLDRRGTGYRLICRLDSGSVEWRSRPSADGSSERARGHRPASSPLWWRCREVDHLSQVRRECRPLRISRRELVRQSRRYTRQVATQLVRPWTRAWNPVTPGWPTAPDWRT